MGKIIPIILALVAAGAGAAAGLYLRPPADVEPAECDAGHPAGDCAGPAVENGEHAVSEVAEGEAKFDYVRMNNQFVVPVVADADVTALVILSLSLEVPLGQSEAVYAQEPKLRDRLLRALFDHANAGGFDGEFTGAGQLDGLRRALRESAAAVLGASVSDVLITDIVRQDG